MSLDRFKIIADKHTISVLLDDRELLLKENAVTWKYIKYNHNEITHVMIPKFKDEYLNLFG